MVHRNARLTPVGRRILVERVEVDGWSGAVAAESMGVSRETAYRWLRRYRAEGVAGFEDRLSRPRRSPSQTTVEIEDRVCELRRGRRWGPHRIAHALQMRRSTVERVLRRRGVSRLDAIDPPTRRVVRRYERAALASYSMSTSRSWDGSPTEEVGGSTGDPTDPAEDKVWVTTCCMSPSMTTHEWPTSKPSPTSKATRVPGSSAEPCNGSLPTMSSSSGS